MGFTVVFFFGLQMGAGGVNAPTGNSLLLALLSDSGTYA